MDSSLHLVRSNHLVRSHCWATSIANPSLCSPHEQYLLGGEERRVWHLHHHCTSAFTMMVVVMLSGDTVASGTLLHPGWELGCKVCLGISRLAKETSQLLRGEGMGKGDKSIRKPIFIGSLMICPEKPDEGGGEGWREMGFYYQPLREASAVLRSGGLGGWQLDT